MERKQKEQLSFIMSQGKFRLIEKEPAYNLSKDFKKEWNPAETAGVEKQIEDIFKPILRKMGIRESVEDYFGLPYTSSSQCAMMAGNCNNWHYITQTDYIDAFLLNNDGFLIISTMDKDENQKYWEYKEVE